MKEAITLSLYLVVVLAMTVGFIRDYHAYRQIDTQELVIVALFLMFLAWLVL